MTTLDNLLKLVGTPRDGALLRFSLGNEYLKAGEAAQAAAHFRAAVEKDPKYSAAWKLLGKALARPDSRVMALIGNEGVVIAAPSLAEAKRNMLSAHVDLIILDLGLPDGAGLDLLSFLNEKALDTPVIIFSATELSADVAQQVKAALVKSRTTNEQLLARIKQII